MQGFSEVIFHCLLSRAESKWLAQSHLAGFVPHSLLISSWCLSHHTKAPFCFSFYREGKITLSKILVLTYKRYGWTLCTFQNQAIPLCCNLYESPLYSILRLELAGLRSYQITAIKLWIALYISFSLYLRNCKKNYKPPNNFCLF